VTDLDVAIDHECCDIVLIHLLRAAQLETSELLQQCLVAVHCEVAENGPHKPILPSLFKELGYHYTDSRNISQIRDKGLMTAAERYSNGVDVAARGAVFGDGIYTANNAKVWRDRGDIGLVVGRLWGRAVRVPGFLDDSQTIEAHTIVGNKRAGYGNNGQLWPADDSQDEVVLRSSGQCLPIVCFDKRLFEHRDGEECVLFIQRALQQILDRLFNVGLEKIGTEQLPLASTQHLHLPLLYTAPTTLGTGVPSNALTPPPACADTDEDCPICFVVLSERPCVALAACGHLFHDDCVQQAFKAKPQCPVCRKAIGEPQGMSPSGEMNVYSSPVKCAGYQEGSIDIHYNIPAAPQLSYHDDPGRRHSGKYATAHLPNNAEGYNLCKRLKYAFMHGLTFTVGTSMTTGAPHQCTVSGCRCIFVSRVLPFVIVTCSSPNGDFCSGPQFITKPLTREGRSPTVSLTPTTLQTATAN